MENEPLRIDNNWLTIEVLYSVETETMRYTLTNQKWADVKTFRETIYNAGLMVPITDVAPGIVSKSERWFVVSPANIKSFVITRQSKKFSI